MGAETKISWTDATWNPIRGCQRTAPEGSKQSGCGDPSGGGCYAERQAARFCGEGQAYEGLIKLTANGPRWSGKARFVSDHLMDPFRWTKPRRIFTDSMSDLFFKGVETWMVDRIVAVMMICCLHERRGGHIFQTLTKRPDRMREYFGDPSTQERVAKAAANLMEDSDSWYDMIAYRKAGLQHPNLWWGTSVENQAAADQRIPELLGTTAAVRFISLEPMLGPTFLTAIGRIRDETLSALEHVIATGIDRPPLDWVIVGCESGPKARRCDLDWIRKVRADCSRARVAFFLKQATLQPGITAGEGSFEKGKGFEGATVVELPYLDGQQSAQFPSLSHLSELGEA